MINQIILSQISILQGSFENIDNEKIINLYDETRRKTDDESDTFYEDFTIPFSEEVRKLSDRLREVFTTNFHVGLDLTGFWLHTQDFNQSTATHSHMKPEDVVDAPNISAVYYLKVPENSGDIVFDYPISKYERNRYTIKSEENNFLVFSSDLDHFVTRSRSHERRFSISFNYKKLCP